MDSSQTMLRVLNLTKPEVYSTLYFLKVFSSQEIQLTKDLVAYPLEIVSSSSYLVHKEKHYV